MTKKQFDVLVTDSEYKHALAVVRCLGRHNLKILTCSSKFSPTNFSKYSKKNYRYKKDNFIQELLKKIKNNKISVVLPIGYHSNILCSKHKKEIEKYSKILVTNYETMAMASDKEQMAKFVKKIGIPVPKTYIVKNLDNVKKILVDSKMVIKSSKEMRGKKVEYIYSKEELIKKLKERLVHSTQIVQEYIEGFGCGFFALYINGKLKASFQHKRIREYPYTGGVSSCASSYYSKEIEEIGRKLLEKLKWNGIAMVEFIYDKKDKQFKFIELNAKFWGSLDLTITSGIEFPYLTYLSALGKDFKKPQYKEGIKFQWVLPEDTLAIKTAPNKLKALGEYLKDLLNPKVKKDIGYLFKDPLPTLIRIVGTIYKFICRKK